MNIKLTLSYDGTAYHGWQEQQNAVTVQGTLLAAIRNVMSDASSVQGVSRTDAGVHAILYTANFCTEKVIPIENITKALNSNLPLDIRVLNAEIVDDEFHAQFDCINKTYIYRISNSEIQCPFDKNYTWHFPYKLDFDKMQEAAKFIIGTKDFSAFCASGEEREDRVRTVNSLDISMSRHSELDSESQIAGQARNDIITIEINADGFLYNMVRIIVGTLIEVGNGRILVDEIQGIIEGKDRTKAGMTAPPHGLFLKEAFY